MVIGVRSWELHLPGAHSLKEKRSVVKSLKQRLHNEFNLSVAETAKHIAEIRGSPEGKEGIASFLEKRKAAWCSPKS